MTCTTSRPNNETIFQRNRWFNRHFTGRRWGLKYRANGKTAFGPLSFRVSSQELTSNFSTRVRTARKSRFRPPRGRGRGIAGSGNSSFSDATHLLRGLRRLVVADGGERGVQGRVRLGARLVRVHDHGLHVVHLLFGLLVLSVHRPVLELRVLLLLLLLWQQVSGRQPFVRLTVVQTPVPADLYLAPDVHAERVRELERVEKRVRDHRRPFVRRPRLQEPADHLRPQHAPLVVRQLNHVAAPVGSGAGFHSHVEFAWTSGKKKKKQTNKPKRSIINNSDAMFYENKLHF